MLLFLSFSHTWPCTLTFSHGYHILFFFSFFLFPFLLEDPDQVPSAYGSLFTDIRTPFFLQANTSVTHGYLNPFLSKSASAEMIK